MDFSKLLMVKVSLLCILFPIVLSATSLQNSGKYTDENRPYEFGFNIEGEQHRKEKKDENGIIMGEFGFITADGVYHVTVYATDENGNFRILSMKNIRLGPAPKKPSTVPPPIPLLTFPPSTALQSVPVRPNPSAGAPSRPALTTPKPLPIPACASCSIPSPIKVSPPDRFQANNPAPGSGPSSFNQQNSQQGLTSTNQQSNNPQVPLTSLQTPFPNGQNSPNGQNNPNRPNGSNNPQNQFNTPNQNGFSNPSVGSSQNNVNGPNNPKAPSTALVTTPEIISSNFQYVDPSALTEKPLPGEREGLPPGITEQNMVDLLYKFNYTVGFHGHREEGYRNGAKVGEYYINGRNGLATKVSYVADDKGYRPKIETVKLSPSETPNEETEKNSEFGLKGYEFIWFYVPKYHNLNQ